MSAEQVVEYLDATKYDIKVVDVPNSPEDRAWVQELIELVPDIVFSTLHGGAGENGMVQGLLDSLGLKYVGSKVLSSAIGMNKQLTKSLLSRAGLPVAKGQLVKFADEVVDMKLPLVVKPNDGGSSVGITMVRDKRMLNKAIRRALDEGENVLIEELVEGEEITCGVVETTDDVVALDVLRIRPCVDFYDFDAKYCDDKTEIVPFEIDKGELERLQLLATDTFKILGCSGSARIDMIYTPKRTVILEINTLPGMTSHSLIPKAAASRWSYKELLDLLIETELNRQ
jgi:D-alanine-D-alanine ligase